jgi:hypothetical protein
LLDAVSGQSRIGWKPGAVGEGLREVIDRSRAVGESEERGRGAVQAMRLLARQIVDDQLVGDPFEEHVGTASPGIRSRHASLHELESQRPGQDSMTTSHDRSAIELFGVSIVLETGVKDLLSALAPRLPPFRTAVSDRPAARRYAVDAADAGIAGGLVVRRGRHTPETVPSMEAALDLIVNDVQRTLADRADGLVFVHAGAVAWQGRALVLPGRSRSGKSELVRALVRAGAEYLSDEFAVFDSEGLVQPYARAIALRRDDGTRAWVSPESLGARTVAHPVAPGLIAFLRFAAGARWRTRSLSSGHAVLGLLRNAVAARRRLSLARSVLVPVASTVTALTGVRGEAEQVAERLLRALASTPPAGVVARRA